VIELAAIWRELANATHERGHAFRLATLATVAEDGSAAARTIVLRGVDSAAGRLLAYTAAHSTKVREIAREPRGTLLFWSPALSWQLRIAVHLAMDMHSAEALAHWQRLQGTTAERDYLNAGTPAFALVIAQARRIEALELRRDGRHVTTNFDLRHPDSRRGSGSEGPPADGPLRF
jgi:pyridoxamine 5'-phosphate oxidase